MTSIWSGSALRFGSVAGSQFGLRTSVPPLADVVLVFHMYGPEEIGCFVYFAPVSLASGTGAVVGSCGEVVELANGCLRWKTIVGSSGVSIAEEMSASLGPLYGPL